MRVSERRRYAPIPVVIISILCLALSPNTVVAQNCGVCFWCDLPGEKVEQWGFANDIWITYGGHCDQFTCWMPCAETEDDEQFYADLRTAARGIVDGGMTGYLNAQQLISKYPDVIKLNAKRKALQVETPCTEGYYTVHIPLPPSVFDGLVMTLRTGSGEPTTRGAARRALSRVSRPFSLLNAVALARGQRWPDLLKQSRQPG